MKRICEREGCNNDISHRGPSARFCADPACRRARNTERRRRLYGKKLPTVRICERRECNNDISHRPPSARFCEDPECIKARNRARVKPKKCKEYGTGPTDYRPIRSQIVNDQRICILLESNSICELDREDFLGEDLDLDPPVFWFARLKAKVEGIGDGTFLMKRLVAILDRLHYNVVCVPNPYGSMSLDKLISFYERYDFIQQEIGDGSICLVRKYKEGRV